MTLGSGWPNHKPYHNPCEGPQTVKATVILHLGWWSAGAGSRTLPWPIIKTTAHGGLRGSRYVMHDHGGQEVILSVDRIMGSYLCIAQAELKVAYVIGYYDEMILICDYVHDYVL
uniref:Uncharacterized protein n=1 Tax=Solanum tuberosum TaxID=4113 RepID=M1E164_SOLTU